MRARKKNPKRIADLVEQLERAGYWLSISSGDLRYEYLESGEPPPSAATLLRELQNHGSEAWKYIGYLTDPRPDLGEDSHLWRRVLELARREHLEAFAVLHGLRCEGARLHLTDAGLRLEPRLQRGEKPRQSGFDCQEEYRKARQHWLLPLSDEITRLFQEVEGDVS